MASHVTVAEEIVQHLIDEGVKCVFGLTGDTVLPILDATPVEAILRTDVYDRKPVREWGRGRVTLLGDAAHPMYPIGSNGASQAILDARALAMAMTDNPTHVDAALLQYEAQRLPPTAAIVRANRGNGPEQVMQLAHERAPDGFTDIDDVVPLAERQAIAAQYKQIAGFSKEALATSQRRSHGEEER